MIGTLAPAPEAIGRSVESCLPDDLSADISLPPDASVIPERDAACAHRDRLYGEFAPLVRRLIRQYGNTPDMREDLTGEIYCRFCALLESFDPSRGVPLRPYLVRQLTHSTHTYARRQWRLERREAAWGFLEISTVSYENATSNQDWLALCSQDDAAALLPDAIANLPARQRNVVIARYYHECSFEEIAEQLGIQTNTARSLLRHGLNNLRRAIQSPAVSSR